MGKTTQKTNSPRCHPACHSSWLNCFLGHMVAIQATRWQKQLQVNCVYESQKKSTVTKWQQMHNLSFVFSQLRSVVVPENGIGRGLEQEMKQEQKSKQKCNSQNQCCRSTSPIQKGQAHSCCSSCNVVDASAQRLHWQDRWLVSVIHAKSPDWIMLANQQHQTQDVAARQGMFC